jgi:lambda family phage portal protein
VRTLALKRTFIDRAIAYVSPEAGVRRAIARAKHEFIYEGARNSRARNGPPVIQTSESSRLQYDRVQLMKQARELAENCGFVKSILLKMVDYVCGSIRYQARTDDEKIDRQYEEYFKSWTKECDITGRHSFTELIHLALISTLRDGDMGFIWRYRSGSIKLQSIEADRIGGPYKVTVTPTYMGGITINADGVPLSYRVYDRTPQNVYGDFKDIPAANFFHLFDPMRLDQYRGITALHAAITNIRDIHEIMEYEKMAVKWASAVAGLITNNTGADDSGTVFDTTATDSNNNPLNIESIEGGRIERLAKGEDFKAFGYDRPSQAFQGLIQTLYREIALSMNIPFGFAYDLSLLNGPGARLESAQAQRSFSRWQHLLEFKLLNPIKNLVILNGIAREEIPNHKLWSKGKWMFPAHPTIDVGRESVANLNENRQGLRSAADIFAEEGKDVNDEYEQIAKEARRRLDLAKKYDVPVTMISLPTSNVPADVVTQTENDPPPKPKPSPFNKR